MDKSIITKAIEKAAGKSIKIEKHEDIKPKKSKKDVLYTEGYFKPSLYLDDKDLASIGTYKVGDKVVLAIECCIKESSSREAEDEKGNKMARTSATFQIESFADITPSGKGD